MSVYLHLNRKSHQIIKAKDYDNIYIHKYYANITAYVKFVHHLERNVVGQVPVLVSKLLQELVELHALWTGTQPLFLDHHVHWYRPVSTPRHITISNGGGSRHGHACLYKAAYV